MAEYNDTEIIVRMNVYIMMALMDEEMAVAEKHFPFSLADVETELQSSLHYNNPAMYYLTLAKFQKHSHYFNEEKINELTNGIRNGIEQLANNFADVTALYLSLAFIKKLTTVDADKFLSLAKNEPGKNHSFRICVGNKKFKDYHEYCSPDFSVAMQICLINEIEKLKTA